MASTINFVEGDGQPFITVTLTDQNGATIDLTGQVPKLTVRNRLGQPAILEAVSMTPASPQTGSSKGMATYQVNETTDDIVPGFYLTQVYVDFSSGRMTFPNDETDLLLIIAERL